MAKDNSKKIKVDSDGFTVLPKGFVKGGQEYEALVYETSYGYKVIPLLPDVKKVYLEVTTLCNFDCTTCIRNSWEDKLGQMACSTFEKILQQLKELPSLECVHFGGFGEPLSHPNLLEMIKSIKELGVEVEMITNGSLLTEDIATKLIDLGLDRLFISMDGPDEDTFEDIRKGADYKEVIDNITLFNKIKNERKAFAPELAFEFVAMKKNFHKLPNLVAKLDELQARYLLVTNVLPYCEELKDEIVYDLEDTIPMFDKSVNWKVSLWAKMPNMKIRTERYCKFVEGKALAITNEGNVAPCYAFMHSYDCYIYDRKKKMYPYHLGNVNESSLKDIWLKEDYASFRARVLDFKFPSCTDCKSLEGCDYPDDNMMDCWGNEPSCSECLWARGIIFCP